MGFLEMKKLALKVPGLFLLLFIIFFIVGCAGEPLKVDLPLEHPANPAAQESEFIPPPNLFQVNIADMEGKPEGESVMKHKMQKEKGPQHGGHSMGMEKESGSASEPTMKPDQSEANHQHKEHSQ